MGPNSQRIYICVFSISVFICINVFVQVMLGAMPLLMPDNPLQTRTESQKNKDEQKNVPQ